jgi:hypothetical protein
MQFSRMRVVLAFVIAPLVPGVLISLAASSAIPLVSATLLGIPYSFGIGGTAYLLAQRYFDVTPLTSVLGGTACGMLLSVAVVPHWFYTWDITLPYVIGALLALAALGALCGIVFWIVGFWTPRNWIG